MKNTLADVNEKKSEMKLVKRKSHLLNCLQKTNGKVYFKGST